MPARAVGITRAAGTAGEGDEVAPWGRRSAATTNAIAATPATIAAPRSAARRRRLRARACIVVAA